MKKLFTVILALTIVVAGFSQEDERSVFTALISVSGIGPRLAQTILSGIQLEELVQAIQNGDLARLTAVSGVGPKTAQRLIVELKEKFSQLGLIKDKSGDNLVLPVLNALEEEAVLALISGHAQRVCLLPAGVVRTFNSPMPLS